MEGSGRGLIFKALSRNSPGEPRKTTKELRTVGILAEIWNQDLPNTKQEC
jgi:hypothetical protein